MINKRKPAFFLCLMGVLAASLSAQAAEYAEVKGQPCPGIFLGTKTTEEIQGPKILPVEIIEAAPETGVEAEPAAANLMKCAGSDSDIVDLTLPAHQAGVTLSLPAVQNAPQTRISGCVGKKQYILAANQHIVSYGKQTGMADGMLDIDASAFFDCPVQKTSIAYDTATKRWVFAAMSDAPESGKQPGLYIAISNDSKIDNETKWHFFMFPKESILPGIAAWSNGSVIMMRPAMDAKALYWSVKGFDGEGNLVGKAFLVVRKKSLFKKEPLATVFAGLASGLVPATNFDKHAKYGYAIAREYVEGAASENFALYRILEQGSKEPTLAGPVAIQVPAYFGSHLAAPHVRHNQLYVCHTVQMDNAGVSASTGDRFGIRWYQFNLAGTHCGLSKGLEEAATVPFLIQSGTLFDASAETPKSYFMPAIMTTVKRNVAIASLAISQGKAPQIVVAGRNKRDPRGFLRPEVVVMENVAAINDNATLLWGIGMPSLSADPKKEKTLWLRAQSLNGTQVIELKAYKAEKLPAPAN
jgi:hypothetical protein